MHSFATQASQLPAALQAELDAFRRWCTTRFYGQQQEPIAEVTAAKYLDHLRRALPHRITTLHALARHFCMCCLRRKRQRAADARMSLMAWSSSFAAVCALRKAVRLDQGLPSSPAGASWGGSTTCAACRWRSCRCAASSPAQNGTASPWLSSTSSGCWRSARSACARRGSSSAASWRRRSTCTTTNRRCGLGLSSLAHAL